VKKPAAKKPHPKIAKPRRRTQRQRAEVLIKQLRAGNFEIENALWAILHEATVGGHPDGSISPESWEGLRGAATALMLLKRGLNDWRYYAQ
jgi:hypothetical protein